MPVPMDSALCCALFFFELLLSQRWLHAGMAAFSPAPTPVISCAVAALAHLLCPTERRRLHSRRCGGGACGAAGPAGWGSAQVGGRLALRLIQLAQQRGALRRRSGLRCVQWGPPAPRPGQHVPAQLQGTVLSRASVRTSTWLGRLEWPGQRVWKLKPVW